MEQKITKRKKVAKPIEQKSEIEIKGKIYVDKDIYIEELENHLKNTKSLVESNESLLKYKEGYLSLLEEIKVLDSQNIHFKKIHKEFISKNFFERLFNIGIYDLLNPATKEISKLSNKTFTPEGIQDVVNGFFIDEENRIISINLLSDNTITIKIIRRDIEGFEPQILRLSTFTFSLLFQCFFEADKRFNIQSELSLKDFLERKGLLKEE